MYFSRLARQKLPTLSPEPFPGNQHFNNERIANNLTGIVQYCISSLREFFNLSRTSLIQLFFIVTRQILRVSSGCGRTMRVNRVNSN